MAHPGAAGRPRRPVRMLITVGCMAAMLAASPAAAAPAHGAVLAVPAHGAVLAVPAGASQAAAVGSGSPAPSRIAAGASGDQSGATHSRSDWGRIEITVGVLVICFGVLAVQAARRRDKLARHLVLPPHHALTSRRSIGTLVK